MLKTWTMFLALKHFSKKDYKLSNFFSLGCLDRPMKGFSSLKEIVLVLDSKSQFVSNL